MTRLCNCIENKIVIKLVYFLVTNFNKKKKRTKPYQCKSGSSKISIFFWIVYDSTQLDFLENFQCLDVVLLLNF